MTSPEKTAIAFSSCSATSCRFCSGLISRVTHAHASASFTPKKRIAAGTRTNHRKNPFIWPPNSSGPANAAAFSGGAKPRLLQRLVGRHLLDRFELSARQDPNRVAQSEPFRFESPARALGPADQLQ